MLSMKISLLAAAFTVMAIAPIAQADTAPEAYKADNTGVNKRDANDTTLTPMDQAKGSKRDVELTRKIRQLIVKNKDMSSDAKNIKIITINGVATLRGPVASVTEKSKIGNLAASVAGVGSVTNELEVKSEQN